LRLFSVHPAASLCSDSAFDVVAIAASAGGFQAIRAILAALPAEFPAAVLVQTHLPPQHTSILVDILRPHTSLPVDWATNGAALRPGTVTIAPPGQHVQVCSEGRLTLISWAQRGYTKPRADGLFESVAASFQARALGVVLTGYLDDGARGARAIHEQGGRVLVQDPRSAEASDMPLATLRTGCVDFVLPIAAMPAALTALVMVRGMAHFFAVPHTARSQPYREALRIWGA
jgi:two-component system chemotaxis response regulator CheB